jgi:hypothetical protein
VKLPNLTKRDDDYGRDVSMGVRVGRGGREGGRVPWAGKVGKARTRFSFVVGARVSGQPGLIAAPALLFPSLQRSDGLNVAMN